MVFQLFNKKIFISLNLVSFFFLIFLFYSCSTKADSEIIGKWVLTYDPDNPNEVEDDMMVFKKNGMVDLGSSKKVYLTCSYEEYEDSVDIICKVQGSEKTLEMIFSEDRTELLNSSGAIYTMQ